MEHRNSMNSTKLGPFSGESEMGNDIFQRYHQYQAIYENATSESKSNRSRSGFGLTNQEPTFEKTSHNLKNSLIIGSFDNSNSRLKIKRGTDVNANPYYKDIKISKITSRSISINSFDQKT